MWQSPLYFKNDLPPVGNILPPTGYAICDCTLPWFLILRSIVTIGKVMIHLLVWTAQCTLTVNKQILERNAKRIWISDIYGFTRLKLPILCWEYTCVMCNMLPLALGTPLAPMTVQLLHNPEHRKSTFHLQFNKYMWTRSLYQYVCMEQCKFLWPKTIWKDRLFFVEERCSLKMSKCEHVQGKFFAAQDSWWSGVLSIERRWITILAADGAAPCLVRFPNPLRKWVGVSMP